MKDVKMWHMYAVLFIIAAFFISYYAVPYFLPLTYDANAVLPVVDVLSSETKTDPVVEKEEVAHIPTPPQVKALYMTSCAASTSSFRARFDDLLSSTELNSIVIDIKDYSGGLSYFSKDESLKSFVSDRCAVRDMEEYVKELHDKGIYVIGRVTVFQDPVYSARYPEVAVKRASDGGIWKDKKGLSYVDPSSKKAWDHTLAISRDAYSIGFDEINYDYIRFPSDGNMKDISFPLSGNRSKPDVMEDFFKYIHDELEGSGIVMSADLFGMTTTAESDLNIGQLLEKALPYFDYIAPMVYPSHYPPHFNGWSDPNKYPYELIKFVMEAAVDRAVATSTRIQTLGSTAIAPTSPQLYTKEVHDKLKLRPWIQDFDYGGDYGPAEVRAQIKATYDAGLDSWMLWDPGNKYTKEALLQN